MSVALKKNFSLFDRISFLLFFFGLYVYGLSGFHAYAFHLYVFFY